MPETPAALRGALRHVARARLCAVVDRRRHRTLHGRAYPPSQRRVEKHGLKIDKTGVFHFHKNITEEIIFSAASLIEPGIFDIDKISKQQIPGISFFMALPLTVNEIEAFDEMLLIIKRISISLKGELLDESGSSLSIQRERYIREQVIEYLLHNNRINSK